MRLASTASQSRALLSVSGVSAALRLVMSWEIATGRCAASLAGLQSIVWTVGCHPDAAAVVGLQDAELGLVALQPDGVRAAS